MRQIPAQSLAGPDPPTAEPSRPAVIGGARSAALGQGALVVAAVGIAMERLVALLSRWLTFFQAPSSPAQPYWVGWAQTAVMLIALVLGIAAIVTRRGRPYGLAAVLLGLLGSALMPTVVYGVVYGVLMSATR
jgi:hypothetical protein